MKKLFKTFLAVMLALVMGMSTVVKSDANVVNAAQPYPLKINVVWQGDAATKIKKYSSLPISVTDPNGKTTGKLEASKGWSTTFMVEKYQTFYLDFKIPFKTTFTTTFDSKSGVWTYYVGTGSPGPQPTPTPTPTPAPKNKTNVTVSIVWEGKAKQNLSKIKSLPVTITDKYGPCKATLSAANGWKQVFVLEKNMQFDCILNLASVYPKYVTSWRCNWNKSKGTFTYYIS